MTRAEPGIYTKVAIALETARKHGIDGAAVLDSADLLLTDRARVQIQLTMLRQVHELLSNPAHRLLTQGGGNTAEDLRRNVAERIEEWINLLESK